MRIRHQIIHLAAAAIILTASTSLAFSQSYPNRPVRLIVPFAPGGAVSLVARGVGQKLGESLGTSVIVDNRGGAGGSMGAEITARAVPDGYTIMMHSASLVTNVLLYPARFDPAKDLAAVSQVSAQPYVLISSPSVPAVSLKELIDYAKANPGKLNYASSGNGSLIHLTSELFQSMTGTRLVHIPFGGMGAAFPDLLSGRIQLAFSSTISAIPHVKSGKLRALAVTSRTRAKSFPDVPPLSEAGVPGFDVTQWYGLFAPAATPRAILDRLYRDTAKLLQQSDVVASLASDGSEPVGSSPTQFTAHFRNEIQKWTKVVRDAGIRGD